ncbi:MAG: outer membrane protein assembly factor BamD [Candidatus Aminicenantes bacterium]|nr:outer membrane protein assembly factor BamD [Candidatus Aminicenantes bacterium]
MKKFGKHITCGWILIWGITIVQAVALNNYHDGFIEEKLAGENSSALYQGKEIDLFFTAKEHVFKRQWDKARTQFERYLKDFPESPYQDEALYWLAQSLNHLSERTEGETSILSLKKQAIQKTNEILRKFPESLWRDDALTLRLEIASQLVLSGEEEYKTYIDEAVKTQKKNEKEIKLLALLSLSDMDPDYVLPIFKQVLEADPDPGIRKQVVSLLGRFFPDQAVPFLEQAARSDKDKRVRTEAEAWIEKVRARQIPVLLSYSVYSSRLLDKTQFTDFPEHSLKTISLSTSGPLDQKDLLNAARQVFDDEVSPFISSANGSIPAYGISWGGENIIITHRAGDYQIWIKPDKLKISEDLIQGEVEFRNRKTNRKQDISFQLNPGDSKLIIMRSSDKLSLVTLQFMPLEPEITQPVSAPTLTADTKEIKEILKKAAPQDIEDPFEKGTDDHGKLEVRAVFNLKPHIQVHTARKYFSIEEFQKNLVNFGQAKAVFSEKENVWTLLGDIIWLKNKECLIGYGAFLADPDRKVTAQGVILVPLKDPSSFQILKGKTLEKEQLLPADESRTRGIYHSISTNVQGWTIKTTLNSSPSLSSNDKWDFSLSQAEQSYKGQDWILIGQILLVREERQFIARQAALINSDGDIVYGDEIHVPTDDPTKYKVIKRQP